MNEPIPLDLPTQRVTVVDFNISFERLVALFMKATFALLLVALFFGFIGFVIFAVVGGMLASR